MSGLVASHAEWDMTIRLPTSGVPRRRTGLRHALLAVTAVLAACIAACTTDAPITALPPEAPPIFTLLDGDWRALYWSAEPAAAESLDVITEGGSITLRIEHGVVSGSLFVPPSVTQGIALTADMSRVVHPEGNGARFVQAEDTFVQRAPWTFLPGDVFDALVLDHVDVESTVFTVVLVRAW